MTRANWEENSVPLSGVIQPVKLNPGQFITGRYELHGQYHQWRKDYETLAPSPRTLWRWLHDLQNMGFLTIKSTNKYSIVTMVNWPCVSSKNEDLCPTDSQQVTTENNKERIKKEGGKHPPKEKDTFKDKGDSRSCKACLRSFIPTKHWHTVCDDCYEPGGRTGARPEFLNKKCQGCGLEASNVVDGLCPFCEDTAAQ